MQELRKVCTETGTILILDEIQSGYGRSGKFFAHQYNHIQPDIITVAKGIGNGFPMAGVLISRCSSPSTDNWELHSAEITWPARQLLP